MYEIRSGELRMTQVALDEIQRMERLHIAPEAVLRELREEYEGRARDICCGGRGAAAGTGRPPRRGIRVARAARCCWPRRNRCSPTFIAARSVPKPTIG